MGRLSFTTTEKRLRNRKYPVYLADVTNSYGYIYNRKLLPDPKDLAELVYQLLARKKGSVYVNGTNAKPILRTQCENGRQRSIEDVFVVAINYVPDLSYERLQEILDPLVNGKERDGVIKGQLFSHHFCNTVKRQVHNPNNLDCSETTIRKALGKNNIIF